MGKAERTVLDLEQSEQFQELRRAHRELIREVRDLRAERDRLRTLLELARTGDEPDTEHPTAEQLDELIERARGPAEAVTALRGAYRQVLGSLFVAQADGGLIVGLPALVLPAC